MKKQVLERIAKLLATNNPYIIFSKPPLVRKSLRVRI